MTPGETLGVLNQRGVLVVPSGDGRLRYRPREALSSADPRPTNHYRCVSCAAATVRALAAVQAAGVSV